MKGLFRDDSGFALAGVIMMSTVLVLFTTFLTARSLADAQAVSLDTTWEQSLYVAESGVDLALHDIDNGGSPTEVVLAAAASKGDVVAAAEAAAAADSDIVTTTPEGEVVVVKQLGDDVLYAVGFTPSRNAASRKVRVIEMRYIPPFSGAGSAFPHGALLANGSVNFTGNGSTSTDPSTVHEATVRTNGNFTGGGGAYVDGDVIANGSAGGGTAYGDITSGAPTFKFPPPAQIVTWQAALLADAQSGTSIGPLTVGNNDDVTLTSPTFINGDLDVRGDLMLTGGGVIYVAGDITMTSAGRIENEGTLAVAGTIRVSGQGEIVATGDPTVTLLVSFAATSEAIELTGGSLADQAGLVYAANGGVTLSGNGTITGAVIAGGAGSLGEVRFTGNGTLKYPVGLVSGSTVLPAGSNAFTIVAQHEL